MWFSLISYVGYCLELHVGISFSDVIVTGYQQSYDVLFGVHNNYTKKDL